MHLKREKRRRISLTIFAVSAAAWTVIIFPKWTLETGTSIPTCGSAGMDLLSESSAGFFNISQVIGWGLMVMAMMLPKLIIPIQLIYAQSLKRLRFSNSLLFVLAYLMTWTIAGFAFLALINALKFFVSDQTFILTFLAVLIIWQCSPIKQRCLNRGHSHRLLSPFGIKARQDSLHFGFVHGLWCIGSGWALMILPMLLPYGHDIAMLLMALIMLSEHLEHPTTPRWRIDLRLRLLKIFVSQGKLLVQKRSTESHFTKESIPGH